MMWNTIAINEKPNKSKEVIVSENYITEEDIKFVAEMSVGSNIQVTNYQTKIFPDKKIDFIGVRRHLNITVKKLEQAEEEVYSYFLKAIPQHVEPEASVITEDIFFYKEANFYRYVAPELLKNTTDNSFLVQCFLVKDNALVLENLSVKKFNIQDRFLDGILLKSALSSLAKLHAASILAENRLEKTFTELHPNIFEEWIFTKTGKMREWFESSVNVLIDVAKFLELDDQHIRKVCDGIFEIISPSKTRQNVVCHGDVKFDNLLFDDSQPTPNCVLVDFQVVRYIPPMADVAQLIHMNCSRELRKTLENDLLVHYYTVFSNELRIGDLKGKIPPYTDMLQQYQELQLYGLVTNALYSPMQYIEGMKYTGLKNDSELPKTALQNRSELVLKIMQEDAIYKDLLKDIVLEINERVDTFPQVKMMN